MEDILPNELELEVVAMSDPDAQSVGSSQKRSPVGLEHFSSDTFFCRDSFLSINDKNVYELKLFVEVII